MGDDAGALFGRIIQLARQPWAAQSVAAAVIKEYEGMWVAYAQGNAVLQSFPFRDAQRDPIYLVDPLGNVVLRYSKDADPSRMKKDLERLKSYVAGL